MWIYILCSRGWNSGLIWNYSLQYEFNSWNMSYNTVFIGLRNHFYGLWHNISKCLISIYIIIKSNALQKDQMNDDYKGDTCIYNISLSLRFNQAANIRPPLVLCDFVTNMSLALSIAFFPCVRDCVLGNTPLTVRASFHLLPSGSFWWRFQIPFV